jgi:hypothetical protein
MPHCILSMKLIKQTELGSQIGIRSRAERDIWIPELGLACLFGRPRAIEVRGDSCKPRNLRVLELDNERGLWRVQSYEDQGPQMTGIRSSMDSSITVDECKWGLT